MIESQMELIDEMLSYLQGNFVDYEPSSQVANFYANRSVFITGATGFIGKSLVEKLVRSCRDIGRIYLLIRDKKGKDAKERLAELIQSSIFMRIRSQPEGLEVLKRKLRAISGDITMEGFGISETDMEEISSEVSVVFNSAATVKFVEPIDVAVRNNVYSVQQLMNVCGKLTGLEALIHLSTAYSQCHKRDTINEIFYEPPMRGEQILRAVAALRDLQDGIRKKFSHEKHHDQHSHQQQPQQLEGKGSERKDEESSGDEQRFYVNNPPSDLLEQFSEIALRRSNRPNTYTFTKAISEYYLLELAEKNHDRYLSSNGAIPIGIIRPSIVGGAWQEPEPGFVDNYNGPTGATMGMFMGAIQAMPGDGNAIGDMVPVDMVTNMLICTSWFLAAQSKKEETEEKWASSADSRIKSDRGVYLFNFVSGTQNPMYWHQLTDVTHELAYKYPTKLMFRLPSAYFFKTGLLYDLYDQLNHRLPAALMDFVQRALTGKAPDKRHSAMAVYWRCRALQDTLAPFTSNQWRYNDANVRALYERLSEKDKRVFPFDVRPINWLDYLRNFIISSRIYTLRDGPKNLPAALSSLKKANWNQIC